MCQLTAAHSFNMHLTEHVRESRWPLLSILSLCLRESIQGGRESQACRWGVSTSSVWGILLNSSFRWPHVVLRMTLGARWCNYAILSSFCGLGNRHKEVNVLCQSETASNRQSWDLNSGCSNPNRSIRMMMSPRNVEEGRKVKGSFKNEQCGCEPQSVGHRETKSEVSQQWRDSAAGKATNAIRGHFWPAMPESQFLGALKSERTGSTLTKWLPRRKEWGNRGCAPGLRVDSPFSE